MIQDLRRANRQIIINLESDGFSHLDHYIDEVLSDLRVILEQRIQPENLEIDVEII